MMMQADTPQPSGPCYNVVNSTASLFGQHDLSNMGTQMDDYDFSSLLTMLDDSNPFHSALLSNDFAAQVPPFDDCLQFGSIMEEDIPMDFEGYHDLFLNDQYSPDQSVTKSDESTNTTSTPYSSVSLPEESMMEIDDSQMSIRHLLKAYGEAMEKGQKELAQVILSSLAEKASPFGDTFERLAFNIITHDTEVNQYDYLKQESLKNFDTAFKAFYQIFPYGKFAHFAANSAILEAVSDDAETIHVVDFDIGEGLQWPPVIEALARKQRTLTITAIKCDEEEEEEDDEKQRKGWVFEETGKKLRNHAAKFGLNLKVEDMSIEDLVCELMKLKSGGGGGGGEWVVFNCMVALPHMGRTRSRRLVEEFLKVAKDFMADSVTSRYSKNRGLLMLGEREFSRKANKNLSDDLESQFEGRLTHYRALLESMESGLPSQLIEARTAIECLFLQPEMSISSWIHKWKEMRNFWPVEDGIELEGLKVSRENLMEAQEMVKGDKSYGVKFEGDKGNQMVLEWRGVPLVRLSTWKSQTVRNTFF